MQLYDGPPVRGRGRTPLVLRHLFWGLGSRSEDLGFRVGSYSPRAAAPVLGFQRSRQALWSGFRFSSRHFRECIYLWMHHASLPAISSSSVKSLDISSRGMGEPGGFLRHSSRRGNCRACDQENDRFQGEFPRALLMALSLADAFSRVWFRSLGVQNLVLRV
jgi:hypothetical protein